MGDQLLKSYLESMGKSYQQLKRALVRVECCKVVDTYTAKSSLDNFYRFLDGPSRFCLVSVITTLGCYPERKNEEMLSLQYNALRGRHQRIHHRSCR
jgi:hypothetical protein